MSAFGALFASKLTDSLRSASGDGAAGSGVHINVSGGQLDPTVVNKLPIAIKHDVFFGIAHAVQSVFIWTVPAGVLIFLFALLIKQVPLRGRAQADGETASAQPELVS